MRQTKNGFTLVELAVVLAMTAILAALLIPSLVNARQNARAVTCRSNLKQLGLALGLYQTDYNDLFPMCNEAASWPIYANGWGKTWQAESGGYLIHPYQILAHEGYLKTGWRDNRDRVLESTLTCPADRAAMRKVKDPSNPLHCRRAHVLGGLTVSYNGNYLLHANMLSGGFRQPAGTMNSPDRTMLSMDFDWWNAGSAWRINSLIRPWGCKSPWSDKNRCAALSRHGGRGSNILWADMHVSYRDAFEWSSTEAFRRTGPSYHDAQYFYWPLGYGL